MLPETIRTQYFKNVMTVRGIALLLGLGLWALQCLVAALWLRRDHYALEWAWRTATPTRRDIPWRRLEARE